MTFRKKLELVLVALFFVFLLFVMSTGSAKADCFPCFDQNTVTYKQKTTKKKNTKQKTVVYDTGGNTGIASYYWQPQAVACGGRLNPRALTAAHRTYPFGTHLRVCHHGCVTVTVNDRGPFVRGRSLDLSYGAARAIGMGSTSAVTVQRLN